MANFNTIQVVNAGRSRTIGTSTDNLELARNLIIPNGIGLESKADAGSDDILVKLADAAGASTLAITDSSNAIVGSIDSDGNMDLSGNLSVTGTIFSRDAERVLISDNFLDINFGYVATTFESGGVAVNTNTVNAATNLSINTAGSNALTFTAVAGAARPKVVCATAGQIPADTFAELDIIQLSGTPNAENDGFFVVDTNAVAGTIEFKSTAKTSPDTVDFKPAQNNVTAEVQNSGTVTISKVKCTVLQVAADGTWETATGSVDGSFATMSDLGSSTLQEAYNLGNTIGLTNGRNLTVTAPAGADTAAISLGADAASNFTTTAANLTLETSSSGTLKVASAALLDLDAGANLDIDVTGSIDMLASTTFSIDGTGNSNVSATSGNLTLSTLTSGTLSLSSAGALTAAAADNSSIAITGTTKTFDIDATGAISINSSAGTIGIGDDAVAQAINIGTGAAARSISVGSNSATTVALNAAAGSASVDLKVAGVSKFAVNGTLNSLDAQYSLAFGTVGTATAPTAATAVVFANASGANITKGKIVALNASGQLQEADCNAGTPGDSIRCPVGAPLAQIDTGASGAVGIGGMVPVFCAADSDCEAADRGKPVYLTATAGAVSTTAPITSGNTIFQVGILQAASSSNLAYILWQPQFIADIT